MTARFRLLIDRELRRRMLMLEHAAATRSDSLRGRELRALKLSLRALAEGREEEYDGKRLGYSRDRHDLRDCAELKVLVVAEVRYGHDLGPSPRLIYREFEAEDGGLPYREVLCFAHRGDNRPFEIAGSRLQRAVGRPDPALAQLPNYRPAFQRGAAQPTGPRRLPLPPDLRRALTAASNVAPASDAVTARPLQQPPATLRRNTPPGRQR